VKEGALLRKGWGLVRRALLDPPSPHAAIEVRPGAVAAVRLQAQGGKSTLAAAALVEIPPGTLAVSMMEPNIKDPAAFRQALRSVVEKTGILGAGKVALVLPDPVARVALLDAAEIKPRGRTDGEEMIRFRLRKAVPFEIRDARLAVAPLPAPPGAKAQILVGAILRSILLEYEDPCRELGLEPGIVTLSGIAIQEVVAASAAPGDDLLVINWDEGYVSLLLSRAQGLVLVRSLTGASAASPEAVARELAQTILYYRERLGGLGLKRVVLRSAALPPDEASRTVEAAAGQRPEILDPWGALSASEPGSAQLLAGAAAILAKRAA